MKTKPRLKGKFARSRQHLKYQLLMIVQAIYFIRVPVVYGLTEILNMSTMSWTYDDDGDTQVDVLTSQQFVINPAITPWQSPTTAK